MAEDRLHFEAASSLEDGATFAITDGNGYQIFDRDKRTGKHVVVAVSQEQAVDSYNYTFECTTHLNQKQAVELRDWLIAHFPI